MWFLGAQTNLPYLTDLVICLHNNILLCTNTTESSLRLTPLVCRLSILRQARRFVRTMLKTSSSCWTSMITSLQLMILLKFRRESEHEHKNRTVTVSKLIERLGLTEGVGGVDTKTNTQAEKRRWWRGKRGGCQFRLQCLISSSYSGTSVPPFLLFATGDYNIEDQPTVPGR